MTITDAREAVNMNTSVSTRDGIAKHISARNVAIVTSSTMMKCVYQWPNGERTRVALTCPGEIIFKRGKDVD